MNLTTVLRRQTPQHAATRSFLALLLCTLVFCALTSLARAQSSDAPVLNVVATTGMLADTLEGVGGERVKVTSLMGPGVDPHTYRQTRSDIERMTRADLVIYHGLHLEAQLLNLLTDLTRHKRVVALAESIPQTSLLADEDYPDRMDPHVWMDPRLWLHVVDAARDVLSEIDPSSKAYFHERATNYRQKLIDMEERTRAWLKTVPANSRVLVTAHDAFRYFGKAHDYEVLGIQGISTESEASLKQIESLVALLVERRIGALFVESSVSEKNVLALVEGAAAKGHTLAIGGELFSDAMGNPGTHEGTYIGMIEHNARTIARALGGTSD